MSPDDDDVLVILDAPEPGAFVDTPWIATYWPNPEYL